MLYHYDNEFMRTHHYVPTLAEMTTVPTLEGAWRMRMLRTLSPAQHVLGTIVALKQQDLPVPETDAIDMLIAVASMGKLKGSMWDPARELVSLDKTNGQVQVRDDKGRINSVRLGRWLRRHFAMQDHHLRDLVAAVTSQIKIEIIDDVKEYADAVGVARSCMSDLSVRCADGERRHPYEVYCPSLGWRLAVAYDCEGQVTHRALVNMSAAGNVYLRSYSVNKCSMGFSQRDSEFEQALEREGFERINSWCGYDVLAIEVGDGCWLMPYIDGRAQGLVMSSCEGFFTIDEYGDAHATNTSGVAEVDDDRVECDDCSGRVHEDNITVVLSSYGDRYVCGDCRDENYEEAIDFSYGERSTEHACPDIIEYVGSACSAGFVAVLEGTILDAIDSGKIVSVSSELMEKYGFEHNYYLTSAMEYIAGLGWVPDTDRENVRDHEDVVDLSCGLTHDEYFAYCGGRDPQGELYDDFLHQSTNVPSVRWYINRGLRTHCAIDAQGEFHYAGDPAQEPLRGYYRLTRPYKGTLFVHEDEMVRAGDGVFHISQRQGELALQVA